MLRSFRHFALATGKFAMTNRKLLVATRKLVLADTIFSMSFPKFGTSDNEPEMSDSNFHSDSLNIPLATMNEPLE
ncbi:MAG: hypothetical protein IT232_02615 [Flavobacteriales bacterium]|nr:hypothetical protein [Flavobacteriales bacterium]